MSDAERIAGLISDIYGEALGALGEVLERLSAGVVFVDRDGRLIHANGPAIRMLTMSDLLSWSDGRPRPRDGRAAAHLDMVLEAMHQREPCLGCCALSFVHGAYNGDRITVQILPLATATRGRAAAPCAAAAAIIVSQQPSDLPHRIQLAARLYALTPAESRVVGVLLTGCTIGGAAKALGIKEATVKTHLQHVFDKTGTRRQVDLAQRIAQCA
jgi:DNA-binding CsgD family transcriptional regulator